MTSSFRPDPERQAAIRAGTITPAVTAIRRQSWKGTMQPWFKRTMTGQQSRNRRPQSRGFSRIDDRQGPAASLLNWWRMLGIAYTGSPA